MLCVTLNRSPQIPIATSVEKINSCWLLAAFNLSIYLLPGYSPTDNRFSDN